MKKYDLFLFDADGTLFDYNMAEANALKIMFENCGFEYTENIRQKYREINSQVWEDFENGRISKEALQTSRFTRLFDSIGVQHDAEDFNAQYLYELGKGSFLIDGASEICEQIAAGNNKIYIVTNGILATQTSRIKNSLIKDYISDFFVSEHIGFQKPHISYFAYVFSHIPQTGRDKILIIGDSLSADIQGGINAGIDTCWFNEAKKENNTGITPTYEIHKLSEIQKFI
jgi:2-haloacid dehalogenase